MKKSLYTLLLVIASVSVATAQTEKGRWTAGANVGNLSYQDQNTLRSFAANLTPSAGYFVANGLLIGTGLPLSLSSSNNRNIRNNTLSTGIGLSPFIRYYFGPSALKPYAGFFYSYVRSSISYKTPLGDVSGTGYSSTLAPTLGIAYFVNRNIALNAGLNYTIRTGKTPGIAFSGQMGPAVRVVDFRTESKLLSLNIGFQLFFGK